MSGLAWIPLLVVTLGQKAPDRPPLRLKIGDSVVVTTPVQAYNGNYPILDDGSTYGRFGRLTLEGMTIAEAERAFRNVLQRFVKPDLVFVQAGSIRSDVIYIGNRGPVGLVPGQNLRQILAGLNTEDADRQDLRIYRGGRIIVHQRLESILKEGSQEGEMLPEANDIISLTPLSFVRFWMMGKVGKPGEYRMNEGTDLYQALSNAGGLADAELLDPGTRIVVRRGPETIEFSPRQDPTKPGPKIENGDTITVIGTQMVQFTIAGEVGNAGQVTTRGNKNLDEVVAQAGPTAGATLTNVILYRRGELFQLDLSGTLQGDRPKPFPVEPGDLVIVRRNERAFFVMGEVGRPGKFMMEDRRRYTATDALALAGGLSGRGTMRRVRIGRPGPDGRMVVTLFNIDEFLKDGKPEANPEVRPGDVLLFGEPKGVTLGTITQALGSLLVVDSVVRK